MQRAISVRVEWALSICPLDVLWRGSAKYKLIPHLCAKDLNCVDRWCLSCRKTTKVLGIVCCRRFSSLSIVAYRTRRVILPHFSLRDARPKTYAHKVFSQLGLAPKVQPGGFFASDTKYKTPASPLGRNPEIGLCITNVICLFLDVKKDLRWRLPSKLPVPQWSGTL